MSKIILDCDLMKYPNSGLYHYCLNLGIHVNRLLEKLGEEKMKFYVPPQEADSFGDRRLAITEKKFHRFIQPFLWDCRIWHAPFQSGRMFPRRHPSVKVVLTIHDLNPLHEGKPLSEQKKSIAHTQWLIHRSTVIICISEFTRSDVLKNCEVGNRPVYVIHNGTHAVGDPRLDSGSYRPHRPFLFSMGYVNRKKNFHVLLPLLKDEELELVVAGRLDEPDYIEGMKQQAEQLGVSERLHILGPVTENEKAWYFQHCAAFALPSLAEGFGAPVVEAMRFGKPVFLSNKTSLPEIGGEVAFYFSDFDPAHMKRTWKEGMESYRRNGLSEKIRAHSTQFDWTEKAKEYLSVYKTLL